MGFLGGPVGISLGWAIGRVINVGTNIYLKSQEMTMETFWPVPWWVVLAAVAFAVIVSLGSDLSLPPAPPGSILSKPCATNNHSWAQPAASAPAHRISIYSQVATGIKVFFLRRQLCLSE